VSETTAVIASGNNERLLVVNRLRVRQAANRLQADCEYLLDEATRLDRTSWIDALTRASIAIRQFIALARRDDAGALFSNDLTPSRQAMEAQRRIVSALMPSAPETMGSPLEEAILLSIVAMRDAASKLLVDVPSARRSSVAELPQDPVAPKAKVLMVDDQPQLLRVLEKAISNMGHATTTTSSGHEALSLARKGDVDLILTDIEMPEMSGIDLLKALKSDEATWHIPVIVISGADDLFHITRCIELGAEDHIAKPYQPEILRARVTASLDRKWLHDLERDQRDGLAQMIEAAEAVERGTYSSDTLNGLRESMDGVGQLARVFDRMVSGVKAREGRLRDRLRMLQSEVIEGRTPAEFATAPRRRVENSIFAKGELINDRYEIIEQLGEGGMGMVFVATDKELHEQVAIKVIRPDVLETDHSLVLRLKSEIRLARRLSHKNIIRAHDLGTWKNLHYITMELVRGISLAELLDQRSRLTVASTLAIATQLCEALAVAHEADVVHRDIKPANLLLSDAGLLKVMDFGIAMSVAGIEHSATTGAGFVVGTPNYMAPEVLLGTKANPSTDLYAVGVVLYESLTGRLPYMGDTPAELVERIYVGKAPWLEREVPGIPQALADLVHQQLEYDPRRRAASAKELVEKLAEIESIA
jgi:CheY-like chemotaxis protein